MELTKHDRKKHGSETENSDARYKLCRVEQTASANSKTINLLGCSHMRECVHVPGSPYAI